MTKEQEMATRNLIAKFTVGSRLYGVNTPKSDHDYEGLFIEDPEYVIGTKNIKEVDFSTKKSGSSEKNTSDDTDYKLYTVRTFFHLAAQANPNKIEWLFIPREHTCYGLFKHEDGSFTQANIWRKIQDNKHLFISKKMLHSFSGYAMSQRKKLRGKKKRYAEFCDFKKVLEEEIARGTKRVGEMDIYEKRTKKKYKSETDSVVEMHYKVIKGDYEWIKYYQTQEGSDCIKVNDKIYNWGMDINVIYENISKIVDTYGKRTQHLEQYGYDVKFAYHLFRLFDEVEEILKTGDLQFPCKNAEFYKNIREGKYTLDQLLDMSKDLDEKINKIAESSAIPNKPDYKGIDKLQQEIYMEYWKQKGLI